MKDNLKKNQTNRVESSLDVNTIITLIICLFFIFRFVYNDKPNKQIVEDDTSSNKNTSYFHGNEMQHLDYINGKTTIYFLYTKLL